MKVLVILDRLMEIDSSYRSFDDGSSFMFCSLFSIHHQDEPTTKKEQA
jgi:hypothetical protein